MPTNPWKTDVMELSRNIVRLALWLAMCLNVFMLACFTVWFTFNFLWRARQFLGRVLFGSEW